MDWPKDEGPHSETVLDHVAGIAASFAGARSIN